MTDTDMIEAMARVIERFVRASPILRIDLIVRAAFAVVQPEIDRLRAENARMREALEPFASRAGRYDPVDTDDGEPDWSTAAPSIRIGDLRRARAALAPKAEPNQ